MQTENPCFIPAFSFALGKAAKSAENAVIPTFPTRWSHGLQHLRHKRPTFAFTSESGYTLGFRRRIAHKGSHAETRGVLGGGAITTLGLFHTFRKPCVAGCQNGILCRFWVLAGCTQKNAESLGTAMRLCASLSRGVAAPLGCVILLLLSKLRLVRPALGAFYAHERCVVSLPSVRSTCC